MAVSSGIACTKNPVLRAVPVGKKPFAEAELLLERPRAASAPFVLHPIDPKARVRAKPTVKVIPVNRKFFVFKL